MAPIGLKAVVGESKIVFRSFCAKTRGNAALRCCGQMRLFVRACACVSAGCGCLLLHLGEDEDGDDEGGAVGVPLYRIVNRGRAVREITCRGCASPGSRGADAQLYFRTRKWL